MKVLALVAAVALAQALHSWSVMLDGPGGSFVGLGAMLLALMGIPVTALLNFLFIQASRRHPKRAFAQKVLLTSCVLPVLQLALLILVKVYRL